MRNIFFTFILIVFTIKVTTAQNRAIGSWTDHLSYTEGTSITTDGEKVFCGTTAGYFIYNTADNSIETRSKVNGLSEVSVKKIAYIPFNKKLLLVYDNGNIDLIHQNRITTIPFIMESEQVSGKNANDIYIQEEIAYISFDFGVVVFNTQANEVKETYSVVENSSNKYIKTTAIKGDIIYVGTNSGIYKGDLNKNLIDFNNWQLLSSHSNNDIKKIFDFKGEIYAVVEMSDEDILYKIDDDNQFNKIERLPKHIYSTSHVHEDELIYLTHDTNYIFNENFAINDAFTAKENDKIIGIVMAKNQLFRVDRHSPVRRWNRAGVMTKFILPRGPSSNKLFGMDAANGELWTVNGGFNFAMNNHFNMLSINRYIEGWWLNYREIDEPSIKGVYDPVSVYLHPTERGHAYISTWSYGLLEFNQSSPFSVYDSSNSTLSYRKAFDGWIGVSGSTMDKEGNLWIVNTHVPNCIAVKKADGSWLSFDFSPDIEHDDRMTDIAITKNGHVWVALDRRNEILVFDYNGTINNKLDDRHIILTPQKGSGNLPGTRGITFKLDKAGQMWVGTSAGLVVHYDPERVFENEHRDLEEILIDDGENVEVLLKGANINAIAIDGANNKWIGTENSGVYQLSPDGKKQLAHFTFKNSPLVSDQIIDIAIDDLHGEVYFGTAKGIVSYKSDIIAAKENLHELKVYPNPVRSDYEGPIGISGLMNKAKVKITDIHGNLVNEFRSEGGQVVWRGDKMNGQKVSSGVYLIMSSAEDEYGVLHTKIGKVLFLK